MYHSCLHVYITYNVQVPVCIKCQGEFPKQEVIKQQFLSLSLHVLISTHNLCEGLHFMKF